MMPPISAPQNHPASRPKPGEVAVYVPRIMSPTPTSNAILNFHHGSDGSRCPQVARTIPTTIRTTDSAAHQKWAQKWGMFITSIYACAPVDATPTSQVKYITLLIFFQSKQARIVEKRRQNKVLVENF